MNAAMHNLGVRLLQQQISEGHRIHGLARHRGNTDDARFERCNLTGDVIQWDINIFGAVKIEYLYRVPLLPTIRSNVHDPKWSHTSARVQSRITILFYARNGMVPCTNEN